MKLLKGPDFQAVDVEVLLGREWLVVEGGAFSGGSSIQLSVQPQTELTTTAEGEEGEGGAKLEKQYIKKHLQHVTS